MKGKPKYKLNDTVEFKVCDEILQGYIFIIDKYGTFDNPTDVSYDIMVESKNCLYKHVTENLVIRKIRKTKISTIVIHGVKYEAVDSPSNDVDFTCENCDIYKARIPQTQAQFPLCLEEEYEKVNKSCCKLFKKGIKRIWKKV